jgi:hypothetical protein
VHLATTLPHVYQEIIKSLAKPQTPLFKTAYASYFIGIRKKTIKKASRIKTMRDAIFALLYK